MHTLTLEQLRATTDAGGVAGVTLKAQGGAFYVQVDTRNGGEAVLTKARSSEPRSFGNPAQALTLLRGLGLLVGSFDVQEWNPEDKAGLRTRPDRAAALRRAHEAASHDEWVREQVQASIDDPRPSVDDEEARRIFASRRESLRQRASKQAGN
jgi:hypothetical protein